MSKLFCRGCGKPKTSEYCPRCGDNRSTKQFQHDLRALAWIWLFIIALGTIAMIAGWKA